MQALQPQLKALQEKHKGDRETLQREMMTLYRENKANPLMGCLPLLLQMPVFLGVFHIIRRLKEGNGPLYGWSWEQFNSAIHADLFGVSISAQFNQGGRAAVLCGILGVIMIATTYLTSRQMILKTGWSDDPTQKMMQRLMLYGIPATLIVSAVAFPLGLIIYWTTTNIFSLGQQMWVLRKYPPPRAAGTPEPKAPLDPEVAKALAPKVGAKPTNPKASTSTKPAATTTAKSTTGAKSTTTGAKRKTVKKNVG
jgi:YidC/Oxa1 family membrane protein insertase